MRRKEEEVEEEKGEEEEKEEEEEEQRTRWTKRSHGTIFRHSGTCDRASKHDIHHRATFFMRYTN
jgi:hypothetical protein